MMRVSILLKFPLLPSLAGAHVMADEVELVAVAAITCVCVPLVARYALHLGLHHGRIIEILAI